MKTILAVLFLFPSVCMGGRNQYVYEGDGYQLTPSYASIYTYDPTAGISLAIDCSSAGTTCYATSMTSGIDESGTFFIDSDGTNGKLTVGQKGSGTYFVSWSCTSQVAANAAIVIGVFKNGFKVAGGISRAFYTADDRMKELGGSVFVYLEEDDYIQLGARADGGFTWNINSAHLTAHRVQEDYIP